MTEPEKPDPYKIPAKNCFERFIIGFICGGISGFSGFMLSEQDIFQSLIFGCFTGFLIGSVGALFGKRVFDFLIELITRFPG